MTSKTTKQIRLYPEEIEALYKICEERWDNRALTLEKEFPHPSKVVKLALRQPLLREALTKLPAAEDKK